MRFPFAIAVLAALGCAASPRRDESLTRRVDNLEADVRSIRQLLEQQSQTQQQVLDQLTRNVEATTSSLRELTSELEQVEQVAVGREAGPPVAPVAPPPVVPTRAGQHDPLTVYAVPIHDSPALGPPHAKVTVVMAMEFACPYCRRAFSTMDDLRQRYGRDVRIVYKNLIVHPQHATVPAVAACAAHRQKKWRAYADLLWTKAFDVRDFSQANMLNLAHEAGLNERRFDVDLHATGPRSCEAEVQRDRDLYAALRVQATPTFFINGRHLAGAQPIEAFAAVVDEELKKANAAISRGVRLRDYYDQIVRAGAPAP
ncbi:MAG: DsbA family protein [Kofleriaceae bacterium]|jgi:protein-disulfide isomerase|nr:DsbA family protein [Kofleriaceae bacterium]MBP6838971.1 DsbA family protein [Kofleriaceae bacterium]MBP9204982.1 DsbA family protein [Kofleriaceae bacterium]